MRTTAGVPLSLLVSFSLLAAGGTINGERKQWHPITITFDGPSTSESDTPNPFRDYRLDVTFSKGTRSILVPGYFAADGNAAESGAAAGNKWRVHFSPDETGTWSYTASFRTGTDIAINSSATAGTATSFNGASGTFDVAATDKSGRDHRGKGRLNYVNEHYLRFANGEWYLKVGPDSPEGFLANPDFDASTVGTRATFSAHGQHWVNGDPTWRGGKGKNVIGVVNYIASKGMNCFYLLLFTGHGDTNSVWPYPSIDDRWRFDCSKLDQWGVSFAHMDKKGTLIHLVFSETENESYWENKDGVSGGFAPSRKLYYREMIARFSHHLAIVWNLGEENGWNDAKGGALGVANTESQRKQFADYIRATDPYNHPIVVHNLPGQENNLYTPLLNHPSFEGTSLQLSYNNFSMQNTNAKIREWVDKSRNAGKKWYVAVDEPGHENFERSSMYGDDTAGVRPDELDPEHNDPRKHSLWGALMAGGGGHETYIGWAYTPWGAGDGSATNLAGWDGWWNQCRYAQQFFTSYLPFHQMQHDNGLTSSSSDFVFAKRNEVYAIYLRDGGTTNIDLAHASGTFEVKWYDPRSGGALQNGSVASFSGGGTRAIGNAPNNASKDWAVLIRKSATPITYNLTVNGGSGDGGYLAGTSVPITASAAPAGQIFDRWTGATVANATSASTTLTMPAANTTVTATYKVAPPVTYALIVNGGTGAGSYTAGTVVNINASAPPAGQVFDRWTGATVAYATSASTTLTMPAANTTVNATYKVAPPITYTLAVNGGTGAGSYAAGTVVSINASVPPTGQVFDRWTGAAVSNATSASTTLIMPAVNSSVTATYRVSTPTGPSITGITLVNADTEQAIGPLVNGQTLNLASLPTRNLNLRAMTNPSLVGSVRFGLDGNANFRTENGAPYTLAGDQDGDCYAWTPSVGSHTLVVTAYSGANASGSVGAPFTISFNVVSSVPFSVTLAAVSSGKAYAKANAAVGAMQYIDRSYTLTALSSELTGGALIRQANDDKMATDAAALTLSVNAAARVYICYDKRATRLPAWLDSSWTLTGLSLASTDTAASPMRVYTKQFTAGSIVLGGNMQAPAAGAMTNYIPIVKPASAATREFEDEITAMEILSDASAWANPGDTDGDGLRDEYELGVGLNVLLTDSNGNGLMDEDELWSDSGLTHFQRQAALQDGGQGGGAQPEEPAQPFTIKRFSVALDFVRAGNDQVALQALVDLPAGYDPSGSLAISIGNATETIVLDSKGTARTAKVSAQLKLRLTRDKTTKQKLFTGGPTQLRVKMKGAFAAALNIGAETSAKNQPINVPVRIQLGILRFSSSCNAKLNSIPNKKAKLKQ